MFKFEAMDPNAEHFSKVERGINELKKGFSEKIKRKKPGTQKKFFPNSTPRTPSSSSPWS